MRGRDHAEALKHLRQFERADLRVLLRVIDGAAAEVCERSQALAKRYLTHCINDKLTAESGGDPQFSPQTMQEKRPPTLEPCALPPRWAISGLVAGRERQLVRAEISSANALASSPCSNCSMRSRNSPA